MFAGSDAGGERAAIIYSLLGTTKLYGIDAEAYFRRVLERIAEHPNNRIDELMDPALRCKRPVLPSTFLALKA